MARSENPLIWSSKLVYKGEFSSAIRGHHGHKATWSPTKGESLAVARKGKEAKQNVEFVVGTHLQAYKRYFPMELSFLIFLSFLSFLIFLYI